jgi:cytochrome oxidase assembly protein ShyY1
MLGIGRTRARPGRYTRETTVAPSGHSRRGGGGDGRRGAALYLHSVRSYRFVFTPKWLGFHVLTWLVLIPSFIGLGQWQRDLWKDRDRAQGVVLSALAAKPVPLDSVSPDGHVVAQSQQWTMVEASGHYDTARQFLVRNRSQNEQPGWYVVTPLVLADGTAVLVNQGWVAESATGGASTLPTTPTAPTGTVSVTGSLQPDETTATTRIRDDTARLPAPEIALITSTDLAKRVPYPLRDGSIRLASSAPANTGQNAAAPIPNPTYDNSMYIAYMIQWWVFALVMPVTWFMLIRREADDLRAARAEAAAAGPPQDDEPVPVAAAAGASVTSASSAAGSEPVE